jgi:hypothetical protein
LSQRGANAQDGSGARPDLSASGPHALARIEEEKGGQQSDEEEEEESEGESLKESSFEEDEEEKIESIEDNLGINDEIEEELDHELMVRVPVHHGINSNFGKMRQRPNSVMVELLNSNKDQKPLENLPAESVPNWNGPADQSLIDQIYL